MSEKKLTREEYAKKMQEKRKELHELSNKEAAAIGKDQDRFLSFLDLHSRLNYTMNNSLLIHAVKPDATAIKDFARWEKEGSHVMKSSKGIQIMEPDGTYLKKDGTPATRYRIKTVFDVSQTNAEPEEVRYDLRDVRDALIFGEEAEYEGMSLSDCIDLACITEGEANDDFVISCARYLLKKRYGLEPNVFDQDSIAYFSDVTEPLGVKSALREVDNIYRTIMKKIDRGLYIKEQEVSEDVE